MLRKLAGELEEMLPGDDPALERVFPPAYPDDPLANEEYEHLVRDDLVAQRVEAVRTFRRTLDAQRISEDELVAWMSSINDIRLVLGTKLEVTEETNFRDLDEDAPDAYHHAIYHYLGWLEEQIVEALAATLEHPGPGRGKKRER
ncbi:MAG TPA: DUF2017 family protein [Actinomycetota bacterium]